MKKTFSARRNFIFSPESWSWGKGFLVVAFCVLVLRLALPGVFWKLAAPLFGGADAGTQMLSTVFGSFTDKVDLVARNQALHEENTALRNENLVLTTRLAEAGLFEDDAGAIARVVARPPQSPYDTLVVALDAGSGVFAGMEAFAPGGIPVGVVEQVLGSFASVELFSAPGRVTEGWVGDTNLPITLRGAGGGTFRATAARAEELREGVSVYVPGPGKQPLGTVARMYDDPSAPAVEVYVVPLANPFALTQIVLRDTGFRFQSTASSTSSTRP